MTAFFIGNDIAINCWKEIPNSHKCLHFVTHIGNSLNYVSPGIWEKSKPVHTSALLAWYMVTYFGAPKDTFSTLNFGVTRTVYHNGKEINFEFVSPDSLSMDIMILFKSDDGDELYAGSGKFTDSLLRHDRISPYLSGQTLQKMYFDATYMECARVPPLKSITRSIIDTIKAHKRKIVYITAGRFGNEGILTVVAKTLNKKIHVPPDKWAILRRLGVEEFFATEETTTYIRTIDYNQISINKVLKRNRLVGPSITVVLSLKLCLAKQDKMADYEKHGIFFFPLTPLNTTCDLRIMKKLSAKEYVFTNLSSGVLRESFGSAPVTTDTSRSDYDKLKLKKFSKYSNKSKNRLLMEMLQKCRPMYYMSMEEYMKWKGGTVMK